MMIFLFLCIGYIFTEIQRPYICHDFKNCAEPEFRRRNGFDFFGDGTLYVCLNQGRWGNCSKYIGFGGTPEEEGWIANGFYSAYRCGVRHDFYSFEKVIEINENCWYDWKIQFYNFMIKANGNTITIGSWKPDESFGLYMYCVIHGQGQCSPWDFLGELEEFENAYQPQFGQSLFLTFVIDHNVDTGEDQVFLYLNGNYTLNTTNFQLDQTFGLFNRFIMAAYKMPYNNEKYKFATGFTEVLTPEEVKMRYDLWKKGDLTCESGIDRPTVMELDRQVNIWMTIAISFICLFGGLMVIGLLVIILMLVIHLLKSTPSRSKVYKKL